MFPKIKGVGKKALNKIKNKKSKKVANKSGLNTKGTIRSNAFCKAATRVGYIQGAFDVGSGIAKNIYNGASAKKTVDDAIVDATFAAAAIVIGAGVTMALPFIGVSAVVATIAGIVASQLFSDVASRYDWKTKYKRMMGV